MTSLLQVPHLTTFLTEPLQTLEKLFLAEQPKIENWLRAQWRKTPPPIYSSVDLRNAGFKIAPVDTNLFPAGFNNLNPAFLPLSIQAAQAAFEHHFSGCQRILLIPENHTRNQFYFESLAVLEEILHKAGFEVKLGSLLPDLAEPLEVELTSGSQLSIEPIKRAGDRIELENFQPCLILLNNDLSEGIPDILNDIVQPILPLPKLGWSHRLKSKHFEYYQTVSEEFSQLLGIDPWFINPLYRSVDQLDFLKRQGEERLVQEAEALFSAIASRYHQHQITQKPFVVVKADAGTYGMGVMTIQSAEEIIELNRKQRTRMATAKGGRKISRVLLQEGVYTFEQWEGAVAEPVVYMIGSYVVGGFYRVHTGRGVTDNLNAPGMHFVPLAFAESCNNPQLQCETESANRFYIYGVIARLALVAAAREQAALRS